MLSRPIELTEYYKWYVGFHPKPRPFMVFEPDHVEATAGVELEDFEVSASISLLDGSIGGIEIDAWDLVDEGTTGSGNVSFTVDGADSVLVSVSDEAAAGIAVIRATGIHGGVVYTGDLKVIVQ